MVRQTGASSTVPITASGGGGDIGALFEQVPGRGGDRVRLVVLEGVLAVTLGERTHDLQPGDCLRYQLFGSSAFATPPHSGARYLIFIL